MTPSKRSERLYLADILEAIDKILGGRQRSVPVRLADPGRNVEIIGEAVRGVTEGTWAVHPEVPWREMAGMRDRVIHDYFRVDLDVVWDVVSQDLRPLREKIAGLVG